MPPEERRAHLIRGRGLFNAGDYWAAHEALETVWRSIISDAAARAWQGLIQAAAALLHWQRGNRHGVAGGGGGALDQPSGPPRPGGGVGTRHFPARPPPAPAGGGGLPRVGFPGGGRDRQPTPRPGH